MTDGRIWLMPNGEEIKSFYVQDGYGIKRLQQAGIVVAVISGRKSDVVTKRMQELKIQHYFQGHDDKWPIAENLLNKLQLNPEQAAYAGDDTPDLAVMTQVGFSIAVANAVPEVKTVADWCTVREGGNGAVREICDMILSFQAIQNY